MILLMFCANMVCAQTSGQKLIDILFDHPVITVTDISEQIGISRQAANKLTSKFEEMNILTEITEKKRYKKYTFVDFVRIIEKGTQI